MRPLISVLSVLSVCWVLCGCRGSRYEIAEVRGTVTCNGKPVPKGIVIFSPIPEDRGSIEDRPGKPGTAKTDENGNFVLSTYGDQDGAVVGKHEVSLGYRGQDWGGEDEEEESGQREPPCGGMLLDPQTQEPKVVEVVGGKVNEIHLEYTNPDVTAGAWAAQ